MSFAETSLEPTTESDLLETPEGEEIPEITPTPDGAASETPTEGEAESTVGTVTIEMVSVSGSPLPSGMEVNLFVFEDMAQVYSTTLTLSDAGLATVDEVPLQTEQFLFATSDHEGVVYGSEVGRIEPETTSVNLVIPYYEPTTDISVLKAERLHIFFDFVSEETIQVFVLYIFANTSDKVLAAESTDAPALVFPLPDGAANLERDTGMEFQDVDTANGFGVLTVYPSADQYQILYSFEMPYEKNKINLDLPVALDTSAVIVMMPENGVEIESDRLIDAGMRDIEGVAYNLYNGSNLKSGDLLDMQVSGKPKAPAVAGETSTGVEPSTGLMIGLAAFGVVLIGAGVYIWLRNRSKDDDWDSDDPYDAADLHETDSPEDLMDAIITLDDLYQKGEMPEDAYLERRAELKERLAKLVS